MSWTRRGFRPEPGLAERLTMALMDRLPADSTRGRQNAEFIPLIISSLVDLGLLVQNHVQQGTVDFNVTVVINKTQFPKSVHEKARARSRRSDHLRQCLLADFR